MSAFGCKATVTDDVKCECYLLLVPGALFWFAPLQRNRTRSPSRKVRASARSMSAFGPKQTRVDALQMSAFGGEADISRTNDRFAHLSEFVRVI